MDVPHPTEETKQTEQVKEFNNVIYCFRERVDSQS
jgi:hypothetical protein